MHYQLEDRALFPSLREVWNGKKRISVEPKVFDLLLHLVKNRGRVVEKDELIDEIWCGRAISDAALSSAVKAARQAMGDSGATQSVIKTLHGKGFRLVGRVEEVERDEAVTDASNDATAGIDLNVPSQASVAIFPFETIGESQCKILAQALSQDITVGLARTRWLFVTSGSSARQLQANGLDANDAGRRLGVRYVLRGSVIQFQNRLRLNVALSEADTEADIWAETFDRKTEDVLQTMQDVANSVVTFVENEIHLRERRRAVLSPIASLDAWAACHRAIDCLYRFSHHAYDEVDQLLQHASRLDPSCARVTAARSFLYWQKAFFEGKMDRGGAMDRAIEFAQESVVLDPHDPQSHWALGRTALMSDYPADAIPSLTTAVEFNPNFANGYYSLAFAQVLIGERSKGLENLQKARRLSPYDPMSFAFLGMEGLLHSLNEDHQMAVDMSKRAIRQPNAHYLARAMAAAAFERAGERDRAVALAANVKDLRPGFSGDHFFRAFRFEPQVRTTLEASFNRLGL